MRLEFEMYGGVFSGAGGVQFQVRRGPPDPAEQGRPDVSRMTSKPTDAPLVHLRAQETFGQTVWLGQETGHNDAWPVVSK